MQKDNAENRWGQHTALSNVCRVCGLESETTYVDGKSGRQVWAHKRLVIGRLDGDEKKRRYGVGHPWRMSKKVNQTIYHQEDKKCLSSTK